MHRACWLILLTVTRAWEGELHYNRGTRREAVRKGFECLFLTLLLLRPHRPCAGCAVKCCDRS